MLRNGQVSKKMISKSIKNFFHPRLMYHDNHEEERNREKSRVHFAEITRRYGIFPLKQNIFKRGGSIEIY